MYPLFREIEWSFAPKTIIANEAASGTNICSHIPGHPDVNPNPLTPTRVMPEHTEATIRMVKTQNPRDLPARI